MIRIDSGVRSTSAREVTISATYSPAPCSRHSRRNARLVTPAIGASTTGVSTTIGPIRSGGSTADRQADRDGVVRALAKLSPRQRRVVVLRHLVGLPEADVAADLGSSVGTVKSTSSRALAQLRATLSDAPDGAAPPSASPSSTPAPRSSR